MKKMLLVSSLIIVLILVSPFIIYSCSVSFSVASDNGAFEEYKIDFEIINDLMLSVDLVEDEEVYLLEFDNGKVTGLYKFPYELNDNQLYSLNQIHDAFSNDFSVIRITENRIDYTGDGAEMYVYSKDGKKPKYFHYKGDNMSFSTESLGENWYYCHARIR